MAANLVLSDQRAKDHELDHFEHERSFAVHQCGECETDEQDKQQELLETECHTHARPAVAALWWLIVAVLFCREDAAANFVAVLGDGLRDFGF